MHNPLFSFPPFVFHTFLRAVVILGGIRMRRTDGKWQKMAAKAALPSSLPYLFIFLNKNTPMSQLNGKLLSEPRGCRISLPFILLLQAQGVRTLPPGPCAGPSVLVFCDVTEDSGDGCLPPPPHPLHVVLVLVFWRKVPQFAACEPGGVCGA